MPKYRITQLLNIWNTVVPLSTPIFQIVYKNQNLSFAYFDTLILFIMSSPTPTPYPFLVSNDASLHAFLKDIEKCFFPNINAPFNKPFVQNYETIKEMIYHFKWKGFAQNARFTSNVSFEIGEQLLCESYRQWCKENAVNGGMNAILIRFGRYIDEHYDKNQDGIRIVRNSRGLEISFKQSEPIVDNIDTSESDIDIENKVESDGDSDKITNKDILLAFYDFTRFRHDILEQVCRLKCGKDISDLENTTINPYVDWKIILCSGRFIKNRFIVPTEELEDVFVQLSRMSRLCDKNSYENMNLFFNQKQPPYLKIEYRNHEQIGRVWII